MRWEPKIGTLLLAMLALTLLVPLLHAPAPREIGETCSANAECRSVNCEFGRCGPSKPWHTGIYVWIGLAVAISAAFIGIAYMAAQLFQLRVIDAWVKIEMQELAAGVIIAVFCIALVASVNASAGFLISAPPNGTPPPNVGEMAKGAIGDIYADGRELYRKLGDAYFNVARIASFSYTAGIGLGVVSTSISSSPAAGLYPLVSEIGGSMDAVGTLLLFLAAQQSFIVFFINASQVMLPVGIFLRCFSLSRKIGGVVLAAVIASAVIYPAAFAVSNEIYKGFRADLQATTAGISVKDPGNPPATGLVCSSLMKGFIESPLSLLAAVVTSSLPDFASKLATLLVATILGGEIGWSIVICLPLQFLGVPYSSCSFVVTKIYVLIKTLFPLIVGGMLTGYSPPLNSADLGALYFNNMRDFALPAAAKFGVLSLVFSLIPVIFAMSLLRNLAVTFGGEPQLYGISKII